MIISDGLPVQFWLSECDTFNEQEVEGINRACWCAPWQCDDEINLQFRDEPGGSFNLLVKDSEGDLLAELPFEETQSGVYAASIIPDDEDICNERIQLLIVGGSGVELLSNPDFVAALTPWTSESGPNANWAWNAGEYAVATGTTDNIIQPFASKAAGIYVFEFRSFSEANGYTIVIEVFNSAVLVQQVVNEVLADGSLQTRRRVVEVTGTFNTIKIRMVPPSGSPAFQLHFAGMQTVTEFAKSDCLHIKTLHGGTKLIEYSNNRNYFGLVYPDTSPFQTFYLRVPAVFFHKKFPQEARAIERTGSTIITSSKLKKQKHLQVHHVPDYFHEKIILALSHHNVTIDDQQWKKEDAYEKDDGNQHYPLKKATVYLTEKNFLARNVL